VVLLGLTAGCHSGEALDWDALRPSAAGDSDGGPISRAAPGEVGPGPSDVPAAVQISAQARDGIATRPAVVTTGVGAASGSSCEANERCQSGHCSKGTCCSRPCSSCEACSIAGRCEPLPECTFPVCDAGICVSGRSPMGAQCSSREGCESGFCVDGMCCDSACDGICQLCSEAGYCNQFTRTDPACPVVTCPDDLECRTYSSPPEHACSAVARCAGVESCVSKDAPAGSPCSEGRRCDGTGECRLDGDGLLPAEPTQLCPAPGAGPSEVRVEADAPGGTCWVGSSWELGATMASGQITTAPGGAGWTLSAYLFGFAGSAKTQAYDASGNLLRGCVAVDNSNDRQSVNVTFSGVTCLGVAFARVTAHASNNGDL
jgi:hypothetical protein